MTKQQLLDFNQALISVDKMSASVAFAYAVALNRKTIKNEVEALEEAFKPRPAYLEFDRERVALCEKLAKKDEKGKPIMINNQYQFEDIKVLEKEMEPIKEKHKEAISEREKQLKEFNEILKQEITFNLKKVRPNELPATITPNLVAGLMPMIDDVEPTKTGV